MGSNQRPRPFAHAIAYGDSGGGKSTFAATWPKPMVVFFFDPFGYGIPAHEAMVMSTEELATVYHIPSSGIETPGLARIQSATSEAPPNLPI